MKNLNMRKMAVIGCGFVGSSSAFALMQSGLFAEIVLIDADRDRAEGEAMDISHGIPFAKPMKIYAGDYSDVSDASLIVVTAGAAQKPGETRLDLVNKNAAIFGSFNNSSRTIIETARSVMISLPNTENRFGLTTETSPK